MPFGGGVSDLLGIAAVFILVGANGFFVTAEFSLVAVRRSRVAELVAAGRRNATVLQHAVNNLDANLAATQLGITISSLALGWLGEPALAHLIEPLLGSIPESIAKAEAHGIAATLAFMIITTLHIVIGELAPKSLALQRSERAALVIVRPLSIFLFLFRPVIAAFNALGNLVLHILGLRDERGDASLHSSEELKLLVQSSREAGILHQEQQDVVVRVLNIGERQISDIMTPRPEVDWIDIEGGQTEIVHTLRACPHEHLLVGRGGIDEPLGIVSKKEILDQLLDGRSLDPLSVMRQPLLIHESMTIFKVLEQFKKAPIQLGTVINEYGNLEGIVTQTDLLEAIAGDLPDVEGGEPDIVEREDGSLLVDGGMPALDAFERLGIKAPPGMDFHTVAGLALMRLSHLPKAGETFLYEGWRFEIIDMDGLRIDKLLARREPRMK